MCLKRSKPSRRRPSTLISLTLALHLLWICPATVMGQPEMEVGFSSLEQPSVLYQADGTEERDAFTAPTEELQTDMKDRGRLEPIRPSESFGGFAGTGSDLFAQTIAAENIKAQLQDGEAMAPSPFVMPEEFKGKRAIVIRGSKGEDGVYEATYLGDEKTVSKVDYLGLKGEDITRYHEDILTRQSHFFQKAQADAGIPESERIPLIIRLDPDGSWAYAKQNAKIRVTLPKENRQVLVEAPALELGEKKTLYTPMATEATPEDEPRNRRLLSAFARWYHSNATGSRTAPQDPRKTLFATKVMKESLPTDLKDRTKKISWTEAVKQYPTERFINLLGIYARVHLPFEWDDRASARGAKLDRDQAKKTAKERWERFEGQSWVKEAAKASEVPGKTRQVMKSLSHEIGHLVHMAAVTPNKLNNDLPMFHMDRGTHTLDTLSSPRFALIEGWALANTIVQLDYPDKATLEGANKISYDHTHDIVRRRLNGWLFENVAEALEVEETDEILTEARQHIGDPVEDFQNLLKKQLESMDKAQEWENALCTLHADKYAQHMMEVDEYMKRLESMAGQPRERYDFLRSEFAVGNSLAKLYDGLGKDDAYRVTETLARHNPETMGALMEAFVRDHPHLKVKVYEILAQASDEILVTKAQARLVKDHQEKMGAKKSIEIDIDRDGSFFGASEEDGVVNASSLNPTLFPAEPTPLPGESDPLLRDYRKSS